MSKAAVGTRAAWVVDADAEVVVLAATDAEAVRIGRMVEAVGILGVRGYLAGGITAWAASGRSVASSPSIDVAELARRLRAGDVVLLDVREDDEWRQGHVEGSIHVPYHELRDGPPDGLAEDEPVAVACAAGNRSSLAVSLLERHGRTNVIHVAGGGVQHLPRHGIELVEGD